MPALTIVANIKAKPDKLDFVKSELEKLAPPTRKESGCVQYDLHQDNDDPTRFLYFENWDSRDLWQQHMQSQHLLDYRVKTEDAIEEFSLFEMTKIA